MRAPGSTARPESARRPAQSGVVAVGVAALAVGVAVLHASGWRGAALLLVGGGLGMTLYHGAFGFTSAYRRAFLQRDMSSPLAQILMLALTSLLFAPLLARAYVGGQAVVPAAAPVDLGVAVGSFLFGIGMQLGSGCASGTLYTVGGGSPRMLVTLAALCGGGFLASLQMGFWQTLPGTGPVVLGAVLGWPLALGVQLAVLLAAALLLVRWRGARAQRALWGRVSVRGVFHGPWPLWLAAVALAVLNVLTLVLAGHPWTITWGLTLWAAKAAVAVGWDPSTSAFWSGGFPAQALRGNLYADITSVMDLGILLGALTAAGLGGRFRPALRIPLRSLVAALLGGLLMGYGARIAYGCNIGAFFSGVASTSLHGWLWIACALPGNWVGTRLRPSFGLDNGA